MMTVVNEKLIQINQIRKKKITERILQILSIQKFRSALKIRQLQICIFSVCLSFLSGMTLDVHDAVCVESVLIHQPAQLVEQPVRVGVLLLRAVELFQALGGLL